MQVDFCTLFDSRYLARALVLYRSLAEHCDDFRLWAFCMDGESQSALDRLSLPYLTTVSLAELEAHDPALSEVKATRSSVEYYWTLSPATPLYVLGRRPEAQTVVRVDADVCFFADPAVALAELGEGSVLLTPHRPSPEFSDAGSARTGPWGGVYNVQFEAFRRDDTGIAALRWWRDRCLEWCYDRTEPGRYGDQRYLDRLPSLFEGVHTLQNPGAGLAPWNVSGHRVERRAGHTLVDGAPLVFHHFQSLEIHRAGAIARCLAQRSRAYRLAESPVPLVWTVGWRLTERELDLLWEPYVQRLGSAISELRDQAVGPPPLRLRTAAYHVARRRLPPRLRDARWRVKEIAWRLRYERAGQGADEPGASRRSAATTRSTSSSDSSG